MQQRRQLSRHRSHRSFLAVFPSSRIFGDSVKEKMFNVLITADEAVWETDQLMRMDAGRFKEYSGSEAESVSVKNLATLKSLEDIDTLLMYEEHSTGVNVELIRYGRLYAIKVVHGDLTFRFEEKGKFTRTVIKDFATRLGIANDFELYSLVSGDDHEHRIPD